MLLAKAHQKVKPPATGLPPQDGAGPRADQRRDLSRGLADRPTWSRTTISPRASADAGWAAVLEHPERTRQHAPVAECRRAILPITSQIVFWLRRSGPERLVRPLAQLPRLRNEPPSGPQRRSEYRPARAAPSGRRGGSRVGEPRIRGAVAPAECQFNVARPATHVNLPTPHLAELPLTPTMSAITRPQRPQCSISDCAERQLRGTTMCRDCRANVYS